MDAAFLDSLRPLLKAYAYNICGIMEEAEDIVQDVFLKFLKIKNPDIQDAKSYLIRMVVNLSINKKKELQKRLSAYPGEWLPEPVATEEADARISRKELLSYSLMVLLEKLNPRQRAVFILKEAFDYGHSEISQVLGITTELSRQLLTRARKQLGTGQQVQNATVPPDFLNNYLAIMEAGDTHRLEQLLNEEITVVSDGGGKAAAAMKPVSGKKSVVALLLGIYNKFSATCIIRKGVVNNQLAIFFYVRGQVTKCQTFSMEEDRVSQIYIIRNPDKLRSLRIV